MILKQINNILDYDARRLCTMFFPFEKIKTEGTDSIEVITEKSENSIKVQAKVYSKTLTKEKELKNIDNLPYEMSVLIFNCLKEITGFNPPWGILFGVRPARLMHRTCDEVGEENAKEVFLNHYFVSKSKTELAFDVMKNENEIIKLSKNNSFSLYISIPFCPSRCSYCSFVSHSIERTLDLVQPYVDLLCKEIATTGKIANKLNLNLETIYFGGGTPTTLSHTQLTQIFTTIENNFNLSNLREYTVEAGRPDTITEQKLLSLKNANVGRISINPQTFNENVLKEIGRKHTIKQTLDALQLAKNIGFDNINMDLIAGLPTDTVESFKNSVDTTISLDLQSITIHTLSLKSSSYMVTDDKEYDLSGKILTSNMVDYSYNQLNKNGFIPYYMYRQSKTLGNLENVGWSKIDCQCLYNVFMMDETHSVFACGAGAVTKIKNPLNNHIDRIYNFKYPYEYLDGFDEMINRKNSILNFYTA